MQQLYIEYDMARPFVNSLFSKFGKVFGDNFETVKVVFKAEKETPSIQIANKQIELSAFSKIEIRNPLNPDI